MEIKLTKKLKRNFQEFFEYHPPKRFSRNLRQMLFEFLESGLRHGFPLYYKDLIFDLEAFFEILDITEDQLRKAKKRFKKINTEASKKKRRSQK